MQVFGIRSKITDDCLARLEEILRPCPFALCPDIHLELGVSETEVPLVEDAVYSVIPLTFDVRYNPSTQQHSLFWFPHMLDHAVENRMSELPYILSDYDLRGAVAISHQVFQVPRDLRAYLNSKSNFQDGMLVLQSAFEFQFAGEELVAYDIDPYLVRK